MPMPHCIGMRALFIGAACLLSQTSFADEAPPLTQGIVTLSALQYKLIDLDPDDGMTPYVVFTPQSRVTIGQNYGLPSESSQAATGPFDDGGLMLHGSQRDGMGSVALGVMRAESTIHQGDEHRLLKDVFGAYRFDIDTYVDTAVKFQLSPNTAIVLEGVMTSDAHVDLSSLVNSSLLQGPTPRYSAMSAYVANRVSIRLGDAYYDPSFSHGIDVGQEVTTAGVRPMTTPWNTYPVQDHAEQAFSLTYRNASWGSQSQVMSLNVLNSTWLYATPAVPEAGAVWYALAGGLCVLVLAGRRRRSLRAAAARQSALLAACALMPVAHAQEPVLARGSGTLTELSYRLIDLDPDDGIAPGITFDPYPHARLLVYDMYWNTGRVALQFLPGGFNDVAAGQALDAVGRGRAYRDASGLGADITVGMKEAERYDIELFGRPANWWSSEVSQDGSPYNNWAFTLSPKTALVLEGRSKAELSMDLSPLIDSAMLQGPQAPYGHIDVDVRGEVQARLLTDLEISPAIGGEPTVVDQSVQLLSARGTVNALGWRRLPPYESGAVPGPVDVAWSLQYANEEGTAQRRAMDLSVQWRAQVTAVVPEPEVMGLACAGLAVLASVRRRRGHTTPA